MPARRAIWTCCPHSYSALQRKPTRRIAELAFTNVERGLEEDMIAEHRPALQELRVVGERCEDVEDAPVPGSLHALEKLCQLAVGLAGIDRFHAGLGHEHAS